MSKPSTTFGLAFHRFIPNVFLFYIAIFVILSTISFTACVKQKMSLKETAQGLTAVEWLEKFYALIISGEKVDPNLLLNYVNQAIRLDPNLGRAYFYRGELYEDLGQYQRAIEDYSQAIRLDPNLGRAYRYRAGVYEDLGQYHRAIEDYSQAIRLFPVPFSYLSRGHSNYYLGQYQRAVEDYTQAIRLDPNDDFAYSFRGTAYKKLGKVERACNDWRKACDLGDCQGLIAAKINGDCR
jgi:tetratricopeptide (TPR) repeat protein